MNGETVKSQLKSLNLSTAAREFDDVISKHKAAVSLNWISELLERELDVRQQRGRKRRIQRAEFPELRTLEEFDWTFNPKIDRGKIEELAKLEFIQNHRIGLFLGKPGTGKTHVALAIGLLAVKANLRVFCASAKSLAYQIALAKAKNTLDVLFKRILTSHLWIVDNWGVVSMSRDIAEEVFDLFDRRKYNSAMILTSNRDIQEWAEVFPDPVLANAAIDRMFDRAEIVVFGDKSYRLKGRIDLPDFKGKKEGKLKPDETCDDTSLNVRKKRVKMESSGGGMR